MKRSHKIATGIALSLSLGLVTGVFAHPGEMGADAGQHMKGGMKDGMGPGAMGPASGRGHRVQLMSPEERATLREKMHNATPEERQKLAATTRAEMHKRAQDKGVTMPEHRGPVAGQRSTPGAAPQAPAAAQHVH